MMAGGMGKYNEGLVRSLERSSEVEAALGASRRHCWVIGPQDDPGPHPALLTAWERRGSQWFGWAIWYSEPDGVVVQQWLPSASLRPVR